jgi:predicted nucleic acid-binding Zn finger protein
MPTATKSPKYVVVSLARSVSKPENFYEIRFSFRDGLHYCTCPAWKFQRVAKNQPRICKHLKALGFELEDLTKRAIGASRTADTAVSVGS